MSKAIIQAMRKRKLFREAKISADPSDMERYKKQRNYVLSMLHAHKQAFFNKLGSADAKEFWRAIELLNNTCHPHEWHYHS